MIISFANPQAREEFLRSHRVGHDKTDNSMYISHFGEYIVLENVSRSILQELRTAPEIEVYEDSRLEPFDATA